MKRYALIGGRDGSIPRYLPSNYEVIGTALDNGQPVTVIGGRDSAGWTLDDYVLPRLASGLIFGTEISLDHPVFKQILERSTTT